MVCAVMSLQNFKSNLVVLERILKQASLRVKIANVVIRVCKFAMTFTVVLPLELQAFYVVPHGLLQFSLLRQYVPNIEVVSGQFIVIFSIVLEIKRQSLVIEGKCSL